VDASVLDGSRSRRRRVCRAVRAQVGPARLVMDPDRSAHEIDQMRGAGSGELCTEATLALALPRAQSAGSGALAAAGAIGGADLRRRGLTIVRAASTSWIASAANTPMRAMAAATRNVIR